MSFSVFNYNCIRWAIIFEIFVKKVIYENLAISMLTFSSLRARFLVRPLVSCRKACCLIRLEVMSSLCNVRFTLRNSAKLSHPSSPRPFQERSSSFSVKFVYTTPKNEKELIWNLSNPFIGIYNTSDFFITRMTVYYRWLLIK